VELRDRLVITSTNFRAIRYPTDQSQTKSRDHPKGLRFDLDSVGPAPDPGLIEAPPGLPALAVKLTRKPTAYAHQRMLRRPLGEFPDHQCHLGIKLERMTTGLP